MSWVRGGHHVLSIEHLLSELRDTDGTELLAATGSEGSEADHEEVETREGNKVDSHLSQIRVQLTRELLHDSNYQYCRCVREDEAHIPGEMWRYRS